MALKKKNETCQPRVPLLPVPETIMLLLGSRSLSTKNLLEKARDVRSHILPRWYLSCGRNVLISGTSGKDFYRSRVENPIYSLAVYIASQRLKVDNQDHEHPFREL